MSLPAGNGSEITWHGRWLLEFFLTKRQQAYTVAQTGTREIVGGSGGKINCQLLGIPTVTRQRSSDCVASEVRTLFKLFEQQKAFD